MNPETDDAVAPAPQTACSPTRSASTTFPRGGSSVALSTASSIRKSQVFQRRLKEKISESRALELLDRRIKGGRADDAEAALGESNQEQDDELVCDSTMVRFEATPEEQEPRACGVLKTVRGIHRQRQRDRQPEAATALHGDTRENQ